MSKKSQDAHRFYAKTATFSYYTGKSDDSRLFEGHDEIKRAIAALDLMGARFDLEEGSVDAQFSGGLDGVLVIITGLYTPRSSASTKPFVNSFYLCKQDTNSYFVQNSVFRALDHKLISGARRGAKAMENVGVSTFSTNDVAAANNATEFVTPTVKPVNDKGSKTLGVTGDEASTPTATPTVEDTVVVTAKQDVKEQDSPVAVAAAVANEDGDEGKGDGDDAAPGKGQGSEESFGKEDVAETSSAPKSWASITAKSRPTQPPVPKPKTEVVTVPAAKVPVVDKSTGGEGATKPPHSMYVKGTTDKVTEKEIEALFSQFGKVVGIQLFPSGFAFVDFEEAAGLEAALSKKNESLLVLRDVKLRCEKRKSVTSPKPSGNGKGGGRREGAKKDGSARNGDGYGKDSTRSGGGQRSKKKE